MACTICGAETGERLCGWCAGRAEEFITSNKNHSAINILWGRGKIGWHDMFSLRKIIEDNHIREVLEFGTGLSTEIFAILGLQIVSCDILKNHSDLYAKLMSLKGIADIIYYPKGELPDFEALYPGRKWEFVFVDGPQERTKETELAIKLSSNLILLHDPGLSEYYLDLPGFRQKGGGGQNKLFERI